MVTAGGWSRGSMREHNTIGRGRARLTLANIVKTAVKVDVDIVADCRLEALRGGHEFVSS